MEKQASGLGASMHAESGAQTAAERPNQDLVVGKASCCYEHVVRVETVHLPLKSS